MRLNSQDAYQLLIKDVITSEEDWNQPENRWLKHCIYVGEAAGRIAAQMELDSDFASALGYVHDIGRKVSHPRHVIEGYSYLMRLGYDEMARSCLTHSFIDNDINLTAGGPLRTDTQAMMLPYLDSHPVNIYDNIVQLCDLFCLDTGYTTVEKRMLDISKRKGVFSNSLEHFHSALNLKVRIEEQLGCSLYDLFPEISKEDILHIRKDRDELERLLVVPMIKKNIN